MWYEILPAASIICAAVTFPSIFSYYFHKLLYNGNPYRRIYTPIFNKDLYLRDMRLSGNPYKMQGLNKIRDDDDVPEPDDDDAPKPGDDVPEPDHTQIPDYIPLADDDTRIPEQIPLADDDTRIPEQIPLADDDTRIPEQIPVPDDAPNDSEIR